MLKFWSKILYPFLLINSPPPPLVHFLCFQYVLLGRRNYLGFTWIHSWISASWQIGSTAFWDWMCDMWDINWSSIAIKSENLSGKQPLPSVLCVPSYRVDIFAENTSLDSFSSQFARICFQKPGGDRVESFPRLRRRWFDRVLWACRGCDRVPQSNAVVRSHSLTFPYSNTVFLLVPSSHGTCTE